MPARAAETLNLKERYGQRWRVTFEETVKGGGGSRDELWWYQEIRGRRGFIYPHSATQLTVYLHRSTQRGLSQSIFPVLNREEWVLKRKGEFEAEFFFPESDLDFAAEMVGARRRRHITLHEHVQLARRALKNFSTRKNRGAQPLGAFNSPKSL